MFPSLRTYLAVCPADHPVIPVFVRLLMFAARIRPSCSENNCFPVCFLKVSVKVILIRFLLGGVIVSSFAVLGDLFKPKSFAGLFGAAPSVALASLALAAIHEGSHTAGVESLSMLVSAIALYCYTSCISWVMMHHPHRVLWTTIAALPVWGAATFGFWYLLLK